MINAASADPELVIFFEFVEATLEVIGRETEIGIQLDDEVPFRHFNLRVAVVEGVYYAATRLAEPAVGAMQRRDPGI